MHGSPEVVTALAIATALAQLTKTGVVTAYVKD
jgi:hypothetical protein